jgi:hypothetical protein
LRTFSEGAAEQITGLSPARCGSKESGDGHPAIAACTGELRLKRGDKLCSIEFGWRSSSKIRVPPRQNIPSH